MSTQSAQSYEIAREFPLEPSEPLYEVADIFQQYGAAYRANHSPTPQQCKAMKAIERCRTTALGNVTNLSANQLIIMYNVTHQTQI